jgi:hypothetical protein
MNEEQLLARITVLESSQKRSYQIAGLILIAMVVALIFQSVQIRNLSNPQKLRCRELSVVDGHGVERVLIAAPLPDPMIAGVRHKRDGVVSGILISDATGTERGGYVTGDGYANAMLTLDGQGTQTVLLMAEPSGDTIFRIWKHDDTGSVTMGVADNPYLNVKQHGQPLLIAPPGNPESLDPRPIFR